MHSDRFMDSQPPHDERRVPRRSLLHLGVASVVGMVFGSPWAQAVAASRTPPAEAVLPLTPSCDDGHRVPTPRQTAGPFYTPKTPERTSLLEPRMPGTNLLVVGKVLTDNCQPLAGVWLDFWQADAAGRYDNQGYTLRGHQFTDAHGYYRLETIVPGQYPARTRHVHVMVQAPRGRVLTTQLYFPNEPSNRRDFIFDSRLVMRVSHTASGEQRARFDFVLPT